MKYTLWVVVILLFAWPVYAQAPQASCEDVRAALGQYAEILGKERNQAQIELAQARAETVTLRAKIAETMKANEKAKEEKK